MVQSRKKGAGINREYFCAFLTQKKLRAYAFKYAASGIAAELHHAESPMPYKVTSSQWRQLQPYVTSRARRGRPPADARKTLEKNEKELTRGEETLAKEERKLLDAEAELERFKKIPLTDEEREMIFSDNIKRVLKL